MNCGILPNVWAWLNRPRTVKFWLLAGAAVLAVLLEISAILTAVERWPPPNSGVEAVALAYMVGLFALAAVLVWRAARAYPADPRER